MASLLFYDNPVPLTVAAHKDLKINHSQHDFSFAANTNSVMIAGIEFSEAAKEYPIVFAEINDQVIPLALLGLRNDENLFVGEDNNWDASYIPAFVRRYPFVMGEDPQAAKQIVCIDEAFPGFSTEEGEPLFEDGEPTPMLKQAIDFVEEYQKQYRRTEQFVGLMKKHDLFVPLQATANLPDGEKLQLGGLLMIDEQKMLKLGDAESLELYRSGGLAWIYAHLISLGTMNRLLAKVGDRTVQEAKAAQAATEATEKPAAKKKAAAKSKAPAKKPAGDK